MSFSRADKRLYLNVFVNLFYIKGDQTAAGPALSLVLPDSKTQGTKSNLPLTIRLDSRGLTVCFELLRRIVLFVALNAING